MNNRVESDSIGELLIPEEAYYGVQSLRAQQNFHISGHPLHPEFISSLAMVKKAAAITNRNAGQLDPILAGAIIAACDEIAAGNLRKEFIVDAIQGGAGTSANMNINEVIANRAIELLGGRKGDYRIVHPNDHVNMAQSTNDVIPTAGKLTVLVLLSSAMGQLERLTTALERKSLEFDHILKMGRTQLQDAVPMRLGQTFHAFASVIHRDIKRLNGIKQEMYPVNLGGTAIGSAINTSPSYLYNVTANLKKLCNIPFISAEDLFDATQNLDSFVSVSNTVKTCAINLSKICNDLRLLSSGPKTGLGEINLPAMQNGSSIMPGKVNPVIPEVVSQVAFQIIGNDTTITLAAEAGQLELNAFEPVLFFNLFQSIDMLGEAVATLTDNCIVGITANEQHCMDLLESSVGISTALCPYIGYQKAAALAKLSLKTGISLRELVLKEQLLTAEELEIILNPISMTQPHVYEAAPHYLKKAASI